MNAFLDEEEGEAEERKREKQGDCKKEARGSQERSKGVARDDQGGRKREARGRKREPRGSQERSKGVARENQGGRLYERQSHFLDDRSLRRGGDHNKNPPMRWLWGFLSRISELSF